jgi:hypothetical protein
VGVIVLVPDETLVEHEIIMNPVALFAPFEVVEFH